MDADHPRQRVKIARRFTANNAVTTAKINNDAVTTAKTDFVGTLTEGKWCTVSGGDIVCTSDAPSGGGSIPTCKADMSNIQIGDTCDDGSKFLGTHPYFGWQGFYVTDTDQSTSSNWSDAVTLCNNLNRHGHTDWYLPSKSELNHLFENKDAIGGFTISYYWSTSGNASQAWRQIFSIGTQDYYPKGNSYDVRCVRREGGGGI